MEKQVSKTTEELQQEIEELKIQLSESKETLEAIRTGAVDALAIQGENGTQIYTLEGADHTYRIFIEEMNEGAVTLTRDGHILYCNNRFANMVNLPLEKVIGTTIFDFVPGEYKSKIENLLELGWEGSGRSEVPINMNSGTLQVQLSIKSLEIDSLKAMYMVVTDITDRIKTEESLISTNNELRQSNSDLEQFAYVASHDLKEPIRMIASYSGLLLSKIKHPSEEVREYTNYISEGVHRVQELIRDLLEYARIGHENIEMAKVDLNKVLKDVLMNLKSTIEESGAEIIFSNLPTVTGNKALLATVFQNLLDNSLKFRKNGAKPVIEIKAVQKDGEWEFSLRDNGIGLNQQYENRIFVIFQRLHTRDKFEGSGIGLSICKKIIAFHGGKIWVQSQEGDGTTFLFTLPG
jgi:PAS domain S-box-containing protein